MSYLWQQNLFGISNKVPERLLTYYHQLQQAAEAYLARLDGTSFREVLPQLNGLGERCSLLFYFLSESNMNPFETSEALIKYIEAEYSRTYKERFEGCGLYQQQSLLCAIQQDKQHELISYLWEENVGVLLARHLEINQQQVVKEYSYLLVYYQRLTNAAMANLSQLTGNNFQQLYPQLLTIDAKCRLLLDSLPFCIAEPTDQRKLIALVEAEYHLTHQELIQENLEWYEIKNSLFQLSNQEECVTEA